MLGKVPELLGWGGKEPSGRHASAGRAVREWVWEEPPAPGRMQLGWWRLRIVLL